MALMRFDMRSHRLVLSRASWAAAAKAARAAVPALIAKGLHYHAAQLAGRAAEFERRAT